MSAEFEDDIKAGGGRKPAPHEVVAIRDYLKSHNRTFSVRATHDELLARDFKVSRATVGRDLQVAGGGNPARNNITRAKTRAHENRRITAKSEVKPAEVKQISLADIKLPPEIALPQMAELLKPENSSTKLAIDENRARMALNIVIANHLAARPELLLLDMRGGAALIDALTIAAKLSGGAAIDITFGGNKIGNGAADEHDMKDITPKQSALVTEIDKWRAKQSGG